MHKSVSVDYKPLSERCLFRGKGQLLLNGMKNALCKSGWCYKIDATRHGKISYRSYSLVRKKKSDWNVLALHQKQLTDDVKKTYLKLKKNFETIMMLVTYVIQSIFKLILLNSIVNAKYLYLHHCFHGLLNYRISLV